MLNFANLVLPIAIILQDLAENSVPNDCLCRQICVKENLFASLMREKLWLIKLAELHSLCMRRSGLTIKCTRSDKAYGYAMFTFSKAGLLLRVASRAGRDCSCKLNLSDPDSMRAQRSAAERETLSSSSLRRKSPLSSVRSASLAATISTRSVHWLESMPGGDDTYAPSTFASPHPQRACSAWRQPPDPVRPGRVSCRLECARYCAPGRAARPARGLVHIVTKCGPDGLEVLQHVDKTSEMLPARELEWRWEGSRISCVSPLPRFIHRKFWRILYRRSLHISLLTVNFQLLKLKIQMRMILCIFKLTVGPAG